MASALAKSLETSWVTLDFAAMTCQARRTLFTAPAKLAEQAGQSHIKLSLDSVFREFRFRFCRVATHKQTVSLRPQSRPRTFFRIKVRCDLDLSDGIPHVRGRSAEAYITTSRSDLVPPVAPATPAFSVSRRNHRSHQIRCQDLAV